MSDTEQIVFSFFGYAPGGYSVRCNDCHNQFTGDKRARRCLPCARTKRKENLAREQNHMSDLENNWS